MGLGEEPITATSVISAQGCSLASASANASSISRFDVFKIGRLVRRNVFAQLHLG